MSLLTYHLKNLLLGLFFNSITNTENLMSENGSDTRHLYVRHILFPLPLFFEESSVPKQLMS